jgi:hypothetical protein
MRQREEAHTLKPVFSVTGTRRSKLMSCCAVLIASGTSFAMEFVTKKFTNSSPFNVFGKVLKSCLWSFTKSRRPLSNMSWKI